MEKNVVRTIPRTKKSIPDNSAKKCCRSNCICIATPTEVKGCHPDPQPLRSSCLPTTGYDGRPYGNEMMDKLETN